MMVIIPQREEAVYIVPGSFPTPACWKLVAYVLILAKS